MHRRVPTIELLCSPGLAAPKEAHGVSICAPITTASLAILVRAYCQPVAAALQCTQSPARSPELTCRLYGVIVEPITCLPRRRC